MMQYRQQGTDQMDEGAHESARGVLHKLVEPAERRGARAAPSRRRRRPTFYVAPSVCRLIDSLPLCACPLYPCPNHTLATARECVLSLHNFIGK